MGNERPMEAVCDNCGYTYGKHNEWTCPGSRGSWKDRPKGIEGSTLINSTWEMDNHEEFLETANGIYESMVDNGIPKGHRPRIRITVEVLYEPEQTRVRRNRL